MLCAGASEMTMSQWASGFAEAALHVDKQMGDLLGPCMFAILMGTSRFLSSRLTKRFSLTAIMAASCALCGVCYITAALSGSPILSLVGCGLCGFSVGIFWPGTFSVAALKLPTGGTAMYALLALAGDLGCSSGPTTVGMVANAAGGDLKAGLLVALVFPIMMLIGLMLLKDEKKAK